MSRMTILEKLGYFLSGTTLGILTLHLIYKNQANNLPNTSKPIPTPQFQTSSQSHHLYPRSEPWKDNYDLQRYGIPEPYADPVRQLGFIGSYNRQLRNPHFSLEKLTKERLSNNSGSRENSKFYEDQNIPYQFRALLKDYAKSGYDRGHLVPAADMKANQTELDQTFILSNMSPQVGVGFNRHYWAYLEDFCRSLTNKFDEVYIVTGPLFLPKKETIDGKDKWLVQYEVIGNPPNVAVPTHFYKVILGVDKGQPKALGGFVLPNTKIPDEVPLERFIVDIDNIEKASGLKFFDKISQPEKLVKLCQHVTCQLNKKFVEKVQSFKN